MKVKMQIKSIFGKLLFEFEKENNTIKDTVEKAVKKGAYLSGAYLYGADLYGAHLSGADLSGANLSGADLYGANLSGADLYGANLSGADLSGIKIKKAIVITGLYKYVVIPFISDNDEKYIKMGCYTRKLLEWKSDFWNNPDEFPNDDSKESNLRMFAFETSEKWFDIIKA